MRRLWTIGLLLTLGLTVGATPSLAKEPMRDPMVRIHSEVVYDGGYVVDGLQQLAAQLEAEFSDDPEALEHIQKAMDMLHALGLDYLGELSQTVHLDDTGYRETFGVAIDPAGANTPIGRWLNHGGTNSTFVRELADTDFLMATTLSRPGDYLALSMERSHQETEMLEGIPGVPAGVLMGLKDFTDHLPQMQAVLSSADSMHIVVWDIDVKGMKGSASLVLEYDESAKPFGDHLAEQSAAKGLTWNATEYEGHTYQVLTKNSHIPLPLTTITEGRYAVVATDLATASKTLNEAMISTRILLPPYVYKLRLNMDRLRKMVPGWAVDMALSQATAEMGDTQMPDFAQLLQQPMGEITAERSATPNALTVNLSMDRQFVHVLYKMYEAAMVAGIKSAIKEEQVRKKHDALEQSGVALRDALYAYLDKHETYPASLDVLVKEHLLDMIPMNPYTGSPMTNVSFDDRTAGDFTYVPLKTGKKITDFQLLIYGPQDAYEDQIDNYERNEDGSFIAGADGYEDMVMTLMSSYDDDTDGEYEDAMY